MSRISNHVEPRGAVEIARHYIRELIYGANDGIITTFAVVAGVAGGGLSLNVVLVCGVANLFADGLSMAVGNYLSIRSHESVLETRGLPEEEAHPTRHGLATFLAFVAAGALPLLPYLLPALLVRSIRLVDRRDAPGVVRCWRLPRARRECAMVARRDGDARARGRGGGRRVQQWRLRRESDALNAAGDCATIAENAATRHRGCRALRAPT